MKLVIFGCGNIAKRIAKSCMLLDEVELVGFASKDIGKAKKYAEDFNCELYGNYDYFLNSNIDAVYIATYNNSHYELIKRCIENRKHVICEKPMLFSCEQIDELFNLAKEYNVLLMEALKSVFLPINIKIKQMIKDKTIGEVKEIYASFMRNGNHPETHWINTKGSGGALKDLGSYTIGTMNYLMDIDPVVIKMETDESEDCADTTAYVELKYGDVIGRSSVSNSIDGDTCLRVKGSKGYIHVENFWKTGKGLYSIDGVEYKLDEECISDFYYELKHFVYLVENNILMSPVMSKEESLKIVRITNKEYD